MKILLFAAALRQDSANKKLIKVVSEMVRQYCEIDLAEFNEFDMPLYNADVQNQEGFPPGMQTFISRLKNTQGLIIASPEYNYSTPGTLKNLIDWVSRAQPQPWKNQNILLMSASPSLVGGNRGLWHTRVPLECCGAFVYPEMFSLANAYEAINEQGELKDPSTHKRLEQNVQAFLQHLQQCHK